MGVARKHKKFPSFFFFRKVKMDIQTVVTLIGSLGFPIVACIAMGIFYATQFKDFKEMIIKNNMLTEELIAILQKKDTNDKNS